MSDRQRRVAALRAALMSRVIPFGRRKLEAEELYRKYVEDHVPLEPRQYTVFMAGAMMGISRGYELGQSNEEQP